MEETPMKKNHGGENIISYYHHDIISSFRIPGSHLGDIWETFGRKEMDGHQYFIVEATMGPGPGPGPWHGLGMGNR